MFLHNTQPKRHQMVLEGSRPKRTVISNLPMRDLAESTLASKKKRLPIDVHKRRSQEKNRLHVQNPLKAMKLTPNLLNAASLHLKKHLLMSKSSIIGFQLWPFSRRKKVWMDADNFHLKQFKVHDFNAKLLAGRLKIETF
jgi:hypothetical protein